MNGLCELRARYPWPDAMPDVPEDESGWLHPNTLQALSDNLFHTTKLIVECGTWKGRSAIAMLQRAPQAHIVCIDTWKGSPEHFRVPEWTELLPTLYEGCQRNLWTWRERATMVRQDSLVGLGEVYKAGLVPDLLYIDSKHSFGRVTAELAMCLELFPHTTVVGDDYLYPDVTRAVDKHVELTGRPMRQCDCAFILAPWEQV